MELAKCSVIEKNTRKWRTENGLRFPGQLGYQGEASVQMRNFSPVDWDRNFVGFYNFTIKDNSHTFEVVIHARQK